MLHHASCPGGFALPGQSLAGSLGSGLGYGLAHCPLPSAHELAFAALSRAMSRVQLRAISGQISGFILKALLSSGWLHVSERELLGLSSSLFIFYLFFFFKKNKRGTSPANSPQGASELALRREPLRIDTDKAFKT